MERCRHPRNKLGSSSLSLPTARHVLRLLISSALQESSCTLNWWVISYNSWRGFLTSGKERSFFCQTVFAPVIARNLGGTLTSSLCYAPVGDIALVTPAQRSCLPRQSSLCRSVPSLAFWEKRHLLCWSSGIIYSIPTSNISCALVLGQLHNLTMVPSPAVKREETYCFPLLP